MAGTILMATGICGSGPMTHDSATGLAQLMPVIANYRDQFYEIMIDRLSEDHRLRLLHEKHQKGQAFAGARQDINARLSQTRAKQLVHLRLASIYARMGYLEAANKQAEIVPATSARIMSQIECLLANSGQLLERQSWAQALENIPRIMQLVRDGIHCGAVVDPWNMLGFEGNFDLFHGPDGTIRDHRVDELVDVMEMTMSLCAQVWSEASAVDDMPLAERASEEFESIAQWWFQFAPHEIFSIGAANPQELFLAAKHGRQIIELVAKGRSSSR